MLYNALCFWPYQREKYDAKMDIDKMVHILLVKYDKSYITKAVSSLGEAMNMKQDTMYDMWPLSIKTTLLMWTLCPISQ